MTGSTEHQQPGSRQALIAEHSGGERSSKFQAVPPKRQRRKIARPE
jgi:hypothetical protein